eukprot:10066576-Lingulodinium_polyedra.AAC.1
MAMNFGSGHNATCTATKRWRSVALHGARVCCGAWLGARSCELAAAVSRARCIAPAVRMKS